MNGWALSRTGIAGAKGSRRGALRVLVVLTANLLLASACTAGVIGMREQPKCEPLEASTFFADGRCARPLVPGTVARGHLEDDPHLFAGRVDGQPAETFPFPITREVLERGQDRYAIFCAPCHGPAGEGDGPIVQRGFPRPPSLLLPRLREALPGYYFDVITNGYGAMFSYADRVPPEDRWAIVAHIRVLQFGQDAPFEVAPP